MDKEPKGVPPVSPKSKGVERLPANTKAQTVAGDLYDRQRSQYSKEPPLSDDPFYDY